MSTYAVSDIHGQYDMFIEELDENLLDDLVTWQYNGIKQ